MPDASGYPFDRCDRIRFAAVDDVRCSEFFGQFQAGGNDIYSYDRVAFGYSRRHNRTHAHAAATEYGNGTSFFRFDAVQYRAGSGLHTATERTQAG
jgi:hypothetical protein